MVLISPMSTMIKNVTLVGKMTYRRKIRLVLIWASHSPQAAHGNSHCEIGVCAPRLFRMAPFSHKYGIYLVEKNGSKRRPKNGGISSEDLFPQNWTWPPPSALALGRNRVVPPLGFFHKVSAFLVFLLDPIS
jgi:hypothetical protein